MFKKKTFQKRKSFLIDTNFSHRRSGKKVRNVLLNMLYKLRFLRHIFKLFHASILITTICIVMAIFIALSLLSPYFKLKKISFVRDNLLLDITKMETTIEEYYGKNLLFLSDSEITQKLQTQFPEFRKIQIHEKWPSEIEIQVEISPPFLNIFNEETTSFWTLSQDGVALQPSATEKLPTIKLFQHKPIITISQQVIESKAIGDVLAAKKLIEEELNLKIKEIHLFNISKEFHLITDSETAIWIDLAQDVTQQIRKLKLADESIGLYSKQFVHIDLRIPDQIFYKER